MPRPSLRRHAAPALGVAKQHISRSPRIRVIAWVLLAGVLALDAAVFTPISLGILYVVPLSLAALSAPVPETLAMALICWVGRLLFGSTGDPLGLTAISLHLGTHTADLANAGMSLFGYLSIAGVLLKLERQKKTIQSLGHEAGSDPLTGIANRRGLNDFLSRLDGSGPVSVIAADIDLFKKINDRFGHDAGDQVLREVASRLAGAVRGGELLARTGGEEFLMVLPGVDAEGAKRIAERLHQAVISRPVSLQAQALEVTISLGVATANGPPNDALLRAADAALYEAKHNGRNRIEVSRAAKVG